MNAEGMRLMATSSRKTSSLGEILIRTRKITRTQLDRLLEEQKSTGRRLGELPPPLPEPYDALNAKMRESWPTSKVSLLRPAVES